MTDTKPVPEDAWRLLCQSVKDLAASTVTICPPETAELIWGEVNYFLDYEPPKNQAELSIRKEQFERLSWRILRALNDVDK